MSTFLTFRRVCLVASLACLTVACAKSVPPIAGSYRSDNGNYAVQVLTSTQLYFDVVGEQRTCSYEQDGDRLTIKTTDTRQPQLTIDAAIENAGATIALKHATTDTGKSSDMTITVSKVLN